MPAGGRVRTDQLFAEGMDHEPHRAEEIMGDALERAAKAAAAF